MSNGADNSDAVLVGAEPQLFVGDIAKSCDFFVRKLGFSLVFTYGEPPFYAQVRRDGARINLRRVSEPVTDPGRSLRDQLLSAIFTVDRPADIDRLFKDFETAGVTFVEPIKNQPWDARTFIVSDTDGNLLLFAGPGPSA